MQKTIIFHAIRISDAKKCLNIVKKNNEYNKTKTKSCSWWMMMTILRRFVWLWRCHIDMRKQIGCKNEENSVLCVAVYWFEKRTIMICWRIIVGTDCDVMSSDCSECLEMELLLLWLIESRSERSLSVDAKHWD